MVIELFMCSKHIYLDPPTTLVKTTMMETRSQKDCEQETLKRPWKRKREGSGLLLSSLPIFLPSLRDMLEVTSFEPQARPALLCVNDALVQSTLENTA
jgi:hypothetical protein